MERVTLALLLALESGFAFESIEAEGALLRLPAHAPPVRWPAGWGSASETHDNEQYAMATPTDRFASDVMAPPPGSGFAYDATHAFAATATQSTVSAPATPEPYGPRNRGQSSVARAGLTSVEPSTSDATSAAVKGEEKKEEKKKTME